MSDLAKLKQLREETGVSFSLCKKALDEANDDSAKAKELLTSWGAEKAASKAERVTKQGGLFSYVHHNKKVAALVELLCETDFVAANSDFQTVGNILAMQVASMNPETKEELLSQPLIREPSKTVDQAIKDLILKTGENITLGRFVRYEV